MDPLAVLTAAVASGVAVLALAHRVVTQLMTRIDLLGASMRADMARQFDDQERHRAEATAAYRSAWDARHQVLLERLAVQSSEIEALRARLDADRAAAADTYVDRSTWLEHVGGINIKLDRLAERMTGTLSSGH